MTIDLPTLKRDQMIRVTLHDIPFTFFTTWGLFSPREVDEGTQLLLGKLTDIKPTDDILDLGCGYGILGIVLAKLAPQGTTHMVDKDFVAIQYARKNAKINELKNTETYLSNGLSDVPENQYFDVIVSNLPAKTGKELHYIMLQEAYDHLKPGGRLYVVTISGLKDYIKRTFNEVFGNYEKIAHSKHYSVGLAIKQ